MSYAYSNPLAVPKRTQAMVGMLAIGMSIGTGGASTIEYLRARGDKGYAFFDVEPNDCGRCDLTSIDPAKQLSYVRQIIPAAVTDFARALNVSRQAIYDWQSGKSITPENAERIADLARAADAFVAAGVTPTAFLMRRKLSAIGDFFDLIRNGESAESAARLLIEILQTEARQRAILERRLAKRPRIDRDSLDDIGAPSLRERE